MDNTKNRNTMSAFRLMPIFMCFYAILLIFLTFISSISEYEVFIDGVEIKTVCDVIRVFEVRDLRKVMALSLLSISAPLLFYSLVTKFAYHAVTIGYALFLVIWVYCFIIRYQACLWF